MLHRAGQKVNENCFEWQCRHLRNTQGKAKDKVHPRTGHEGPEGEKSYRSTLPLTSALLGVGVKRHASASLPRGRPSTQCTGWWEGLRAGLDGCERSRSHRDSTHKTFENKDCVTTHNLLYHQRKQFWMSISFNINEDNSFWNDDDRNSSILVFLF